MTFVSYAQNFEDVILLRALKHIENGFYIDIGAQDPTVDSVSLTFYDRGWRGIHVEPTPRYANKLRAARGDEIVIEAAIGTQEGKVDFFEVENTGLSTGDQACASEHEKNGRVTNKISVTCLPLSKLLDAHRDRDVHWLKIDVEGMERAVLESWSPSEVRPWIVVVESTKPLSSELTFASWDHLLVSLGYEFVYFDGINRFYVSTEHLELKSSFGHGPCVFDDFMLSGLASAPFCGGLKAANAHLDATVIELRQGVAIFEKSELDWRRERKILESKISALEAFVKRATNPSWFRRVFADLWSRVVIKSNGRPRRVFRHPLPVLPRMAPPRSRCAPPQSSPQATLSDTAPPELVDEPDEVRNIYNRLLAERNSLWN